MSKQSECASQKVNTKNNNAMMKAGTGNAYAGTCGWHRGGCTQETTDPPGDFAGDGLSHETINV